MKVNNRTRSSSSIVYLIFVLMVSSVFLDFAGASRRRRASQHRHRGNKHLSFKFDVKMPGASPHKPEEYICTYRKLPSKQSLYIVEFDPHASRTTAHHILIYGCKGMFSRQKRWTCGGSVCLGEKIIFAWAKDAPALHVPKGVGFEVSGNTDINYIAMQIHYARSFKVGEYDHSGIILHMTRHKMTYLAFIYLFASGDAVIPSKTKGYHADMICKYEGSYDMVPFAFRTHSHELGRVISAYRVRDSKWSLIGIGNPQLPQAFYPVKPENKMKISFGDILAARCTYDSPNRTTTTYIGGTSNDEMCNFYMMYYSIDQSRVRRHGEKYFDDDDGGEENEIDQVCSGLAVKLEFPSDSDKLPPELMVNGSRHANHVMGGEADETDDADGQDGDDNVDDKIEDSSPAKPSLNGQSTPMDETKISNTRTSEDKQTSGDILPTEIDVHNSFTNERNGKSEKDVSREANHKQVKKLSKDNDNTKSEKLSGKKDEISNKNNTKTQNVSGTEDVKLSNGKVYNSKQTNKFNDDEVKTKENGEKVVNKMEHHKHKISSGSMTSHSDSHLKKSNDNSVKQGTKIDLESDLDQLMIVDDEGQDSDAEVKVPSHSSHKTNPGHTVGKPNVDGDWPYQRKGLKDLGQVSGVAINKDGHIVVFHRGPRKWRENTFDMDFRMTNYNNLDPIGVPTILHLDPKSGDVIKRQGKDMFFLPHGLTIDVHDNIWVTDVGSHQVMKFTPNGHLPTLIVGQRHEPGDDGEHFCQPADIAVEESGIFYVADGYCNSRIMKFSSHGKLIKKWGHGNRNFEEVSNIPGEFAIPHSLALDEKHNRLYVADRENGRIQVFDTRGKFITQYNHKEFGTSLYALNFNSADGGILYAVNGPSSSERGTDTLGFTMNGTTGVILNKWSPSSKGFSRPHDIESCADNSAVYVVEIGPNRVWKFVLPSTKPDFKGVFHQSSNPITKQAAYLTSNDTEEDDTILILPPKTKKPEPVISSNLMPAIVVIAILATPVCLICVAAAMQHMRMKHKRGRILRKRDEDSLLHKPSGLCGCCYTKKYYYDNKRGFDKLIGEESDESGSDYFIRKGAI